MAASPYEQLETRVSPPACVSRSVIAFALDAAVMMPRGSADVRGEQLAALETEHHALLTTPKVARLLERAEGGCFLTGRLAAGKFARDAPAARSRHRDATIAHFSPRQGHGPCRVFWVEAKKGE